MKTETYARVHGLSALEGDAAAAAASDAVDAALVVEQMGRAYGIPRDELVTEALDLASDGAAERLVEATEGAGRPVGLLVNNAGFGFYGPQEEQGPERTLRMLRLNVGALLPDDG